MGFDLKNLNKTAPEQIIKAMVYTDMHILWGILDVVENQFPDRLLTGAFIPDNVCLKEAKYINAKSMGNEKPLNAKKILIPTEKILGFHLRDDDEENPAHEENRVKKQFVILLGVFKVTASIWIGPKIDIHKHLELSKSQFMEVFDVSISNPGFKELKPIQANKMSIRKDGVIYLIN